MSRTDQETIEIEGEIVVETERAWLIRADDDEEYWLPKSQCTDNGDGTFSVPEWLAAARGML